MARWMGSRGGRRLATVAALTVIAGCTVTEVASAPTDREAEQTESSSTTTTTTPPSTQSTTTTTKPKRTTTTQRATTTTQPATTTTWPTNREPIAEAPAVAGNSGLAAQRLLALGFWHNGSSDTIAHAAVAAQKYYGLATTGGAIDQALLDTLARQQVQAHARSDAGTLVEIDKTRQLLFILENGETLWVINTSTGSEIPYEEAGQNESEGETLNGDAVTYPGFYAVWRQHDGRRKGDLGGLYRPKYFNGGIAVHGSSSGLQNGPWSVPMSHGCTRITDAAMDFIWEQDLMPMGIPVWVHGEIPT